MIVTRRERLADLLTGGALTRARADAAHHRRAHATVGADLEAERKRANSAVNLCVDRTAHATRLAGQLRAVDELLDSEGAPHAVTTTARVHAALAAVRGHSETRAVAERHATMLLGAILGRFRSSPTNPHATWIATCSRAQLDHWCSRYDELSRAGDGPSGPPTPTGSDEEGTPGSEAPPQPHSGAESAHIAKARDLAADVDGYFARRREDTRTRSASEEATDA